jgi:hypothetical protein
MREFLNENPFITKIDDFLRKTVGSFIGDSPDMSDLPLLETI